MVGADRILFWNECNAIALQPNLQWSEPRSCGSESNCAPSPSRATPASPRPHAVNEENAALRKAIEDADYEYGVGLLHLNQHTGPRHRGRLAGDRPKKHN